MQLAELLSTFSSNAIEVAHGFKFSGFDLTQLTQGILYRQGLQWTTPSQATKPSAKSNPGLIYLAAVLLRLNFLNSVVGPKTRNETESSFNFPSRRYNAAEFSQHHKYERPLSEPCGLQPEYLTAENNFSV
jgi:hypothetical protein